MKYRLNWKNNFKVNIGVRIVLLTFSIFVFTYIALNDGMYFWTLTLVLLGIGYQLHLIFSMIDDTNLELYNFLSSIRYDDFTHTYSRLEGRGGSFEKLYQKFNEVMENFKNIRSEKEAEYQYLKNIIHHVGIGILSFDKRGDIQIINTTAKRLLKSNRLTNVQQIEVFSPELLENLKQLRTGSKSLIRIDYNGEIIHLAMYAIELYLKGEEYKLITLQNIHHELEEQEMDAWQNLIRVLTHEIMNSVAPISSLASTVEGEVESLKEQETLQPSDLEDVQMAVQTIKSRSEGLIRFVNEFRSLTHTPKPQLAHVPVHRLFEQVRLLMGQECMKHNIALTINLNPESLIVTADAELIQQVLINLIKNSIQALQAQGKNNPQKQITLIAQQDNNCRPIISVRDNGPGIAKEAMERIFIPFYTTKKQGSGIGLSLSRQIMRQHKGTIVVRSSAEEGTEFSLKF
jgi:nitrogen fixation/metabolism regulation signal transduction histidine kinase